MSMIGHAKLYKQLSKDFKNKSFAHAYLFSGQNQLGKKTLAKDLIKIANCSQKNAPCNNCQNCLMIEKEKFPDLLVVKSADSTSSLKDDTDKKEIDIKQIRGAQNFLAYKPYYSFAKSVIIDDADRMNLEAQNCFLKSLEEPKGDAIIFLVSSKPEILLKTIFSRCQMIKFYPVATKEIKKYLQEDGLAEKQASILAEISLGRPGRAIELKDSKEKIEAEENLSKEIVKTLNSTLADKFKYVKSLDLEKNNVGDIIEVIEKYLRYRLFKNLGFEISKEQEYFFSSDTKFSQRTTKEIKNAINLAQDISNTLTFTNANPKLALEVLLMEV